MSLLARVLQISSDKHSTKKSSSASTTITPVSSRTSQVSKSSSSPPQSVNQSPHSAYTLSINIESPPIVLYGAPGDCTGSIISGILKLTNEDSIELENVTLSLVQTMQYTKPFTLPNSSSVSGCKKCNTRVTDLARWDILTVATSFPPGEHAYPFSHLLPGSLPPTSKLGSLHSQSFIKYELVAVVTDTDGKVKKLVIPVNIARSIIRGPDRNSVRIFPPTEVTTNAVLPNVIYPKATFPIELKIDNIVSSSQQRRWRMRKLSWRIEENTKVRAYTCEKHIPKLQMVEKAYSKSSKANLPHTTGTKTSSMHHSTVLTNISLMTSPSNLESQPQNLDDGIPDSEPLNDAEHDIEETIRSGPSHAHENFIEDFVNPNQRNSTTHESDLSVQPSIQTPQPRDTDKHLYLEETRTVSYGDIKSGWKSDFSGRGKIELVANINTTNCSTGMINHINTLSSEDAPIVLDTKKGANFSCDIDDPTLGVFVSHTMIVEVVIAEELVHNLERKRAGSGTSKDLAPVQSRSSVVSNDGGKSSSSGPVQMGVPTGAARVLRMQFKLPVTERSGLGIAWDDEVPPTYEDVSTLSPPTYNDHTSSSSTITPVMSDSERPTPNVLYGRGETPVIGNFGLDLSHVNSIDAMVDNIQEFSL
ncbi:hypothetical protein MG3_01055 [Candida albicans P78048]|uniref:LDB19 N-terminal domain-containing protein n=1 Tax=Candida albicans P78048 TaxID=1094989 RepID=A0AB34PWL3_CANAX|nr:hypothetical protein MG3_01055 [Candida albicans P78048]